MKWAVVGMGRAGKLRADALESDDRVVSVIRSSRRNPRPSFDDILSSDVEGVALCRESERHFEDGHRILETGKHLLMEYPLGGSFAEVETLLDLARAKNRSCHVGHLLLLSEWHKAVTRWLATTPIQECCYWFDGGFGSAPARMVELGAWGSLLVPRLHHLWSWFGPLKFRNVDISVTQAGFSVDVELGCQTAEIIHLRETRQAGLTRKRGLSGKDRLGRALKAPPWFRTVELFKKDTSHALDVCLGGETVPPLVSREDLLGVRTLADTVQRAVGRQSL